MRGTAISLLMIVVAWPMALFYNDPRLFPLVAVISIAPAMRSVISPRMVLFMQRFDFRREFALDLLAKGATLIFSVGVVLATDSYWGLAIGAVAGPTTSTIVSYIFAPMRPRLSLSEWKHFQDMVGWNTVSQVLNSLNWQMDRLMLPRFTSLSTYGAFSVADNLAGIPYQTFVGPLMRPLMAAFSNVADRGQQITAYLKATNAIMVVAAPILLVIILLAEPIVRIVVGEKWIVAAPILQWLCIVSLIGLPTTIMPSLVMVLDKTRYVALRMFAEFAVRAPVTVVGVVMFGLEGALAARVIAAVVAYLVCLVIMQRLIGVSIGAQLYAFVRPLVACVPMVGFLLLVQPVLVAIPLGLELVVVVGFCSIGALALFWVFSLFLWQAVGRPDGLEAIIVRKIVPWRNGVVVS
jgi:O-antigen/teichoic acid export membrane protein